MFKVKRPRDSGIPIVITADGAEIDPACRFLAYLNAKGFSPNTVSAYAHDLVHLWTFLSTQNIHWTNLTPELSVGFLAHLRAMPSGRKRQASAIRLAAMDGADVKPRLSAATINRALAAVGAFYKWARFTGTFSGPNPIAKTADLSAWLATDLHRPFLAGVTRRKLEVRDLSLRTVQRLPRPMSHQQVVSILGALRNLRDRSLILLMLNAGLRPGEALGLHLSDIGYGRRRVFVRCRDDHPKGARSKSRVERVVDLHDGVTLNTLNAYVMSERPHDTTSSFIFLVGGDGSRRAEPLSYSALARLFARACERAGIREPWVTPHALRHTHATQMWEAGMRELTLQRRLGHASPESTRIYTRVSDAVVVAEYRAALGMKRDQSNDKGEKS